MGTKASNTFDVPMTNMDNPSAGQTSKLSRLKLTDKERAKLQDMIRKADSLEEIKRLEDALDQGKLPPGFTVGDEMEE